MGDGVASLAADGGEAVGSHSDRVRGDERSNPTQEKCDIAFRFSQKIEKFRER
jgi:hypothetical protein